MVLQGLAPKRSLVASQPALPLPRSLHSRRLHLASCRYQPHCRPLLPRSPKLANATHTYPPTHLPTHPPTGKLVHQPGEFARFSRTRRMVAVLATFVASGLIHEGLFW